MSASALNILLWHVHGSWSTAFLQGRHQYLLPVVPDRGPDGLGRARTWQWPSSAVERTPEDLRETHIDAVILQRPRDIELVTQWTGRRPGIDMPAIYLEHNAPEPHPVLSRHVMAERTDIPIVHVTHFNELFWDSGRARTMVIEHGVIDPGARYTGEVPHAGLVVNEPARRGRMVGADLFPAFAEVGPLDLFGMPDLPESPAIQTYGDIPQEVMHTELARRRLYLHTTRWTSLGLALIEAMHLGMPVVAVDSTEAREAVPANGGVVSTNIAVLQDAMRCYLKDPDAARAAGAVARAYALSRYGLARFLRDWDDALDSVIA
jgi:glycosyltransferase involved in cell wall biosynthesis